MKKIKQCSHLSNVSYQFVVSIIELLEHHWVSALVWMALESRLPERLLDHFSIRSEAALLLHPQY